MHKNRPHKVVVLFIEEVAHKLTRNEWTTCTGFSCGSLTLLNDSTSPDGAQEYVVIKDGKEIESLTVSWMTEEKLLATLRKLDADPNPTTYGVYVPGPKHPDGSCSRCV